MSIQKDSKKVVVVGPTYVGKSVLFSESGPSTSLCTAVALAQSFEVPSVHFVSALGQDDVTTVSDHTGIVPVVSLVDTNHAAQSSTFREHPALISAGLLAPNTIAWNQFSLGWVHVSGNLGALSDSAAQTALEALQAGRAQGATVSVDLTGLSKFVDVFKIESQDLFPRMRLLGAAADVLIGNIADFEAGFAVFDSPKDSVCEKADRYRRYISDLCEMFSSVRAVGIFLRNGNVYAPNLPEGFLWEDEVLHQVKTESITPHSDTGVAGAFAAGLIFGFLRRFPPDDVLEIACRAAVYNAQTKSVLLTAQHEAFLPKRLR